MEVHGTKLSPLLTASFAEYSFPGPLLLVCLVAFKRPRVIGVNLQQAPASTPVRTLTGNTLRIHHLPII